MGIEELGNIATTVTTFIDIAERLVKLPKDQRDYYRKVISETYRLLDLAMLIPVNRLSKMLTIPPSDKLAFVNQLRQLEDFQEWRQIERHVSLCETLYSAGEEMDAATTKLKNIFIPDREKLRKIIDKLVKGETGFAEEITNSVKDLAAMANDAEVSSKVYNDAREAVRNKRDYLENIRLDLIAEHIKNREVLSLKPSNG